MRTVRTKVYQFNELSKSAQDRAINWYRNSDNDSMYHISSEIIHSAKAMAEMFNLKFGREYTDIKTGHIDDNILELKGVRLYKYIVNNYGQYLFTPKYIKAIDRVLRCKQFICKVNKGNSGEYTMLYSKMQKTSSCVLTGMCYDDNILQPVYDFLSRPDKSTTFADIVSDIKGAISTTFRKEEEWVDSDEYIIEEIEANEYEFTIDGNRF